ncbi:PHB depolymerase family esterase [uncultured Massilia sp.]|uniref:extracellular catalytic domain type 2 short-chain-length polyhydroxyalkanoate depolymerase n=1 Tax=uncultured Massilia sp. TaxID=169973 RepID=UPI0025F30A28|nr:PHB depolymerase family esterase [uncultured Massilia sp.]
MRPLLISLFACALLHGTAGAAALDAEPLPALRADLSRVSVSGLDAGGFLAADLATAYSATFMGAGILEAGPYHCVGSRPANVSPLAAAQDCMAPLSAALAPDPAAAYASAVRDAAAGRIDPVRNLERQRVYLFAGQNDRIVKPAAVAAADGYYRRAGVAPEQLRFVQHPEAGHAIVTNSADDFPCNAAALPYINQCGFMQSHEMLRHIYPDMTNAPAARPTGRLLRFDQAAFVAGARTAMDASAWVYVPARCAQGGCAVHVALHGCRQGQSAIGQRFVQGTGYNEFADANGIVVLYPQVHASDVPANPRGCWDFWGYADAATLHTRDAPQARAIVAMVRRLGAAQ